MEHFYVSRDYAHSFSAIGQPWFESTSGLWLLKRRIENKLISSVSANNGQGLEKNTVDLFDLISCHPHSVLSAETDLALFHENCRQHQFISTTVITDPFIHPPLKTLEQHFDRVHPYKVHYVYDPNRSHYLAKTHRYEHKRAIDQCSVKTVPFDQHIDVLTSFYERFAERHRYQDWQLYTADYFKQLAHQPIIMIVVYYRKVAIGMSLWFEYTNYLYHHLTLTQTEANAGRVMFATIPYLIENIAGDKIISLGGGSGIQDEVSDGLNRYKKAFANHSRMSYFCGKILDREQYQRLTHPQINQQTHYFPAYRDKLILSALTDIVE